MSVVFLIVALLALSYVLSRATDTLVTGITQLSENTSFEASGLTALFVALATSLPELFVGAMSALEGKSGLPLGMVIGSNIANISLVLGGSAVISGLVRARDEVLMRDVLYSFLIGSLPLLLLLDRNLSRVDGVVLLVVYVAFNVMTLRGKKREQLDVVEHEYYEEKGLGHRILSFMGKRDVEQGMGRLVVGSVLLLVSSELIVRLAGQIAEAMKAPVLFVGLFMVSVGTSLPEFAFEIKTIAKKEYLMAFGNIVGSTVVNSSLVLGVVALLKPVVLSTEAANTYLISVIAFVLMAAVFWLMTYTKRQLERWEGGVLVVLYFVFVLVQLQYS